MLKTMQGTRARSRGPDRSDIGQCGSCNLDYRLVVVRDCCADPDAEVHALLDIVIAKQSAVVTMS